MANSKRRCRHCKKYFQASDGIVINGGFYCSHEHVLAFAQAKAPSKREEVSRERHRQRKKKVKPLKQWQDKLQDLINQWVKYVRDNDKPCCTCGTMAPGIKYDAGHYRTRGACPELRYELSNIHKQCSVRCNQYGSGMRAEYREFIIAKYGQAHLDWLDGPHEPLSKDWEWYEAQIKKWRQTLRDEGLTPVV